MCIGVGCKVPPMAKLSEKQKLVRLAGIAAGGAGFLGFILGYGGDEKFYSRVVMPTLHRVTGADPERAHSWAVWAARNRLFPKERHLKGSGMAHMDLSTTAFGVTFANPVGMAAGFDKHCEAVRGMEDVGFGFVEVGTVTPNEQPGNEAPRVFRLSEDEAVINRYGFNSVGHEAVFGRLSAIRSDVGGERVNAKIGVNLGKNKTSADPVKDYVDGVKKFGNVADYLVINVSSPNTPGLRDFQRSAQLEGLISSVVAARDELTADEKKALPVLLKVAPDLKDEEKEDIARVIQKPKCKVDGLIVSNTTTSRPDSLKSSSKSESGGLSGAPLKEMATKTVADFYRLTNGSVPIVGVGGISSGGDAYAKIRAGASLVQIYTSFIFHGPPVVKRIKRELAEALKRDGFPDVQSAVGADHRRQDQQER